jgi:hypothetical protein
VFSSALLLLMGLHKYYGGYQNSTTYRASAIRWLLQLMFKNVSLTVLRTVHLLHLIEWCIHTCIHYVHNNTDISGQDITVRTTQTFQKKLSANSTVFCFHYSMWHTYTHKKTSYVYLLNKSWNFLYITSSYGKSFLSALYTLSYPERFYCVTPYLTEKLSKLRSYERQ